MISILRNRSIQFKWVYSVDHVDVQFESEIKDVA